MTRVRDPSLHPEEAHVVITSTRAMSDKATSLANFGALLWIRGNRPCTNATDIRNAIVSKFVIDRKYIKVVSHYPEDFFVLFTHPHHCNNVTASRDRFSHGEMDIHVAKWRSEANTDLVEVYYHVHLCIENLSLNASCNEVATQVLDRDTFVHYFDVATVQKEDSSSLNLWAWSANPSTIPKVLRLMTTGGQPAGYINGPSTVVGRRGLKRRVLVHLDLVEDFMPDINDNVPQRPHSSHPFPIPLGVIDGESTLRDGSEMVVQRCDDDQDGVGHEDDRDRGRRDRGDRPSSWRDRFFQSRSCAWDLAAATPPHVASLGIDGGIAPEGQAWDPAVVAPEEARVTPERGSATRASETEPATPVFLPATETLPCIPMFTKCRPPLLPLPKSPSPRPRPPTKRRKTLAGVVNFNINRSSTRLHAKNRKLPIVKMADKLLCPRMGIIDEGQHVTEEAIAKFVAMFQGQLPDITMLALWALFNLDCDDDGCRGDPN
ncbi:hypothetical protein ZWY2020_044997 [Hordeum vulgare]|nr:hypothetical protein ZWY2020_044997 [Hordeum vulgare]